MEKTETNFQAENVNVYVRVDTILKFNNSKVYSNESIKF